MHNGEEEARLQVGDDLALQYIKENKNLRRLILTFNYAQSDDVSRTQLHELGVTVRDSNIERIEIVAVPLRINFDGLLRPLQDAKNLRSLHIRMEPNPQDYESLACAINNPNLTQLLFYASVKPDLSFLMPVLSSHPALKEFTLGSFQDGGSRALGEIIKTNKSIEKFNPSAERLRPLSATEMNDMIAGFKHNSTIREVDLQNLSREALDLVSVALANHQFNVQTLRIGGAEFSSNNAALLSTALKTNTTLTSLDLSDCLSPLAFTAFCEGLAHNLALQSLILNSSNNPGPSGIKALCDALKHHTRLTLLDLSYCNITDDECPYLADLLVHTKALRSLLLTDNSFEDEGLKLLSDAIIKNNTLHKLDIGGEMEFGNDGLTAVKEMLSNNRTLRQFILYLYFPQKKFVDLLCEGLEQNDCLRYLQIDHSSCWTEEQENIENRLNEVLKHNYALDTMHLGGSSVDCEALLPLLNRNKRLKSETQFKVVILSHNIARSHEALSTLPREIWKSILSTITHPGMEAFTELVENIFNLYAMDTS
jgi:hypothetical protein